MMYFNIIANGLAKLPAQSLDIRAALEKRCLNEGLTALWEELHSVAPQRAAGLSPADRTRVLRALELHALNAPFPTEHEKNPAFLKPSLRLQLHPTEKNSLQEAIVQRTEAMFAAGLCEEAATLIEQNALNPIYQSFKTLGYPILWEWYHGQLSKEEAKHRIVIATRQLAKRQFTWMKKLPGEVVQGSREEQQQITYAKLRDFLQQNGVA